MMTSAQQLCMALANTGRRVKLTGGSALLTSSVCVSDCSIACSAVSCHAECLSEVSLFSTGSCALMLVCMFHGILVPYADGA